MFLSVPGVDGYSVMFTCLRCSGNLGFNRFHLGSILMGGWAEDGENSDQGPGSPVPENVAVDGSS